MRRRRAAAILAGGGPGGASRVESLSGALFEIVFARASRGLLRAHWSVLALRMAQVGARQRLLAAVGGGARSGAVAQIKWTGTDAEPPDDELQVSVFFALFPHTNNNDNPYHTPRAHPPPTHTHSRDAHCAQLLLKGAFGTPSPAHVAAATEAVSAIAPGVDAASDAHKARVREFAALLSLRSKCWGGVAAAAAGPDGGPWRALMLAPVADAAVPGGCGGRVRRRVPRIVHGSAGGARLRAVGPHHRCWERSEGGAGAVRGLSRAGALTAHHRLLVIRALRPDCVAVGVTRLVDLALGEGFMSRPEVRAARVAGATGCPLA